MLLCVFQPPFVLSLAGELQGSRCGRRRVSKQERDRALGMLLSLYGNQHGAGGGDGGEAGIGGRLPGRGPAGKGANPRIGVLNEGSGFASRFLLVDVGSLGWPEFVPARPSGARSQVILWAVTGDGGGWVSQGSLQCAHHSAKGPQLPCQV